MKTITPVRYTRGALGSKIIATSDGEEICRFDTSDFEPEIANKHAAFIVRACNSHKDLLKALKASRR